jgi:UPF0271 protein
MDVGNLPPRLRPVLLTLASMMRSREPAIRQRVEKLRAENPGLDADQLAKKLIHSTRSRLALTAAAAGATAVVPGLGTMIALGTATGQSLYALEQETELVLAIAMIHGRELGRSDERLIEALVVIGLVGGGVKLRDNVLVAGGQSITVAAFRRLPATWAGRAGNRVLARVLGRTLAHRVTASVARAIPLAVGATAGAGFDWVTVTVLGRAAMHYYRRAVEPSAVTGFTEPALPAPEYLDDAESGG